MLSTTEETNNYRKAFYNYYNEKILPDLEEFEAYRQPVLKQYYLYCALVVFSFVFIIVFIIYSGNLGYHLDKGTCKILGLIPFGFVYLAHKTKKNFEKTVKEKVINSFLSFFGRFNWSMDCCIDKEDLLNSGLTGEITKIENDDYFRGFHDGICITISEVKLIRGSGQYSSCTFNGLFIKLDLNKQTKHHTIIIENPSFCSFLTSGLPNHFPQMEKVELEDPEFNKHYHVFSQDQVEARYLLTPSFMERFKNLKEIYKTNHIRASFQKNSVLIAMSSDKDLFVLGDITKSVTDSKEVQTLFEEFAAVLSLIEALKLNIKTCL